MLTSIKECKLVGRLVIRRRMPGTIVPDSRNHTREIDMYYVILFNKRHTVGLDASKLRTQLRVSTIELDNSIVLNFLLIVEGPYLV